MFAQFAANKMSFFLHTHLDAGQRVGRAERAAAAGADAREAAGNDAREAPGGVGDQGRGPEEAPALAHRYSDR